MSLNSSRSPGVLAAALAFATGIACGGPQARLNGPEARPEIILSTEAKDRVLGEREAEEVAAELGLLRDPALTRYLERIGRRLVPHTKRRRFEYTFQIVDQEAPNAFALPGGFIYVSRGLMALANSEDELANVVAHEIVHVSARHAAGRQRAAATEVNPLMLPGVLMGAVLGERVGEVLVAPFQIFNVGFIARYSREQEREADRQGQQLAARAGFDPDGMARFLHNLENAERLRMGASRMPGFLDSHPATPERIADAASRAREIQWNASVGFRRNVDDYLRRLDGLPVGTNPREGVFDGDRFLHPDLNFTLRFPEGWKLVNTPRAVGAVGPRGAAEVFLEFQSEGDDPTAAATDYFEKLPRHLSIRVTRRETVRIGGLPARRVIGLASTESGTRYVELTWIAHEGTVYRITAAAPAGPSKRYRGALRNVARSFRALTPQQRESIRTMVLRIQRARHGEVLEDLSRRSGNEWDQQKTAVMNGLFPGTHLESGQLVKIAVSEPYRGAPPEDPDPTRANAE